MCFFATNIQKFVLVTPGWSYFKYSHFTQVCGDCGETGGNWNTFPALIPQYISHLQYFCFIGLTGRFLSVFTTRGDSDQTIGYNWNNNNIDNFNNFNINNTNKNNKNNHNKKDITNNNISAIIDPIWTRF